MEVIQFAFIVAAAFDLTWPDRSDDFLNGQGRRRLLHEVECMEVGIGTCEVFGEGLGKTQAIQRAGLFEQVRADQQ